MRIMQGVLFIAKIQKVCQGWGMNAGIAGTIASVVNTLLAVIVSYPLLKFWVMPKSGDKKEAAK